jgi:tRNA (guanine-N7-)-methyltransferase
MTGERRSRSTEAFFGRRRGKTVRAVQAGALAEILPRLALDLATPSPASLAGLFEVPVDAVRLEIGFGAGEHLLHEARRFPATGFIGVEPFVNGMAKFLASWQEDPLPNIRLYDDDATRLLDWLPDSTLTGIDLFYPDPWPKKRHWKRRFVNAANLDRFARVMAPGALFRFASDIETYVDWTLQRCRVNDAFAWTATCAADWNEPYEGWPGTRYEAKAIREGRRPAYLAFRRN